MIKKINQLIFASAILLHVSGCSLVQANTQHPKGYETYITPGEQFKHSSFSTINNDIVELGDTRKLIILFATWCSDSQRTLKELQASPLINDPTIQIIAIGRNEQRETLEEFNQEYNLPFALVADPSREIYSQYANAGIPRLILLDKSNNVVKTLIGEQPNIIDELNW
ncbi:Thiol-disulfide oxidoreductase ResA [Pseudoalteromonas holothuriae]|uniref:Thiol-disulfide oxidoreductase ResA n=1 Tax=Pseudoalteromonas holothuriae TaxID=2963714 RepID=A0A9W4R4A5_9GAMM|nr:MULTISPECIES: TlpA disulfide reductase family protein [unclassified Pseudoalteromonas]CAH9065433.1 Thiol-disulfide oxidoreductase ResA [Pseudoalteromonas sp. CIP111854]CAH9067116.1 Thiol-disulfide oxidoreductase ResA [Pseudoalteromonas sp. CIP111951]